MALYFRAGLHRIVYLRRGFYTHHMALIYETTHFIVESHEQPFLPRTDGGHIRLKVKDESIEDRAQIQAPLAIEYMRLSMIVGEALYIAMNNRGIPVVKINYQDMGNWAFKLGKRPYLHYHIFGRASNAVKQPWPESMYLPDRKTGFYDGFEPLNAADIEEIQKQITIVEAQEKYRLDKWGLI
jgi:diadenosine tetraphosphate (Ap4A) HIT family hydrolase